MSQKQSDQLDKLYKEYFNAQFEGGSAEQEAQILRSIRRLEKETDGYLRIDEGEAKMETYRESVRADGATV